MQPIAAFPTQRQRGMEKGEGETCVGGQGPDSTLKTTDVLGHLAGTEPPGGLGSFTEP